MGTKFEKGQTVWGCVVRFGELRIGSARVKACGEKMVKLDEGKEPAFRYRSQVPIEDVFATEMEALTSAYTESMRAEENAEAELRRAQEMTLRIRSAMEDRSGMP